MCGTTRLEDAEAAVRYGVDVLGFIFYAKSPRNISIEHAARIIQKIPPFIDRVGVFVNAPIKEVQASAGAGLSYLQLHGNESVEYCLQLRQQLPFCGLIKAFRIGEESLAEDFTPYNECVDAFLLDTYLQGSNGGTGKVFDWSIIKGLKLQRPILLAGGLSPENVVGAIAEVQPFALDINSGVESKPGVKDHVRLKELLQLVYSTALK